jgi:hypothetical protein
MPRWAQTTLLQFIAMNFPSRRTTYLAGGRVGGFGCMCDAEYGLTISPEAMRVLEPFKLRGRSFEYQMMTTEV